MPKSYIDPTAVLTRQEKKNLHRKNPHQVIPKGRRKYQCPVFKLKQILQQQLRVQIQVQWDSIANKPDFFPPATMFECEVVVHDKDN